MKDSQPKKRTCTLTVKYIKESNERFSTVMTWNPRPVLSISRRVMKDSQHFETHLEARVKYIKESNERFSTAVAPAVGAL